MAYLLNTNPAESAVKKEYYSRQTNCVIKSEKMGTNCLFSFSLT